MRNRITSVLLAVVVVAVVGAALASAQGGPVSCQDIRDNNPSAADGDYTIWPNNQEFVVYCHDMAGTPREYLTLVNTGGFYNYAQYTAGGASPGTTVTTHYDKVRLDPTTLLVHIGDQTFANSVGELLHSGDDEVTSMPYGVAMDCIGSSSTTGRANVDLRGLPFEVDDTFALGGFGVAGSAIYSNDDQVVDVSAGGYCGWMNPAPWSYDPYNQSGGFQLDLRYVYVYAEGGFVTGGGWIDSPEGAYKPDDTLAGKANFGFVSKYKKGADTPTGNTEFQFHAASLNFHSSRYESLAVTNLTGGNVARFKGTGTLNGMGDYKLMLWAGDGTGTDGADTFRIKIWEEDDVGNETVTYDNGFAQHIGGGSIVIHPKGT